MSTVHTAPALGWAPRGVASRRSPALLALVAVAVVAAGLSVAPRALSPSAPAPAAAPAAPEAARALSSLPLSFEPNVGQAPDGVAFVARVGGATLSLSPTAATLAGPAGGVRLGLVGSNPDAAMAGVEPRPGRVNYLRGDDPQKWRTNVETFAKVHYAGLYPGIDLVHYGNGGELEYDFVAAPGADPHLIAMDADAPARIEDNGDLLIGSGDTALRQRRPVAYQDVGGVRRPVSAEFRLGRDGQVGFSVGDYDRSRTLVIDPLIYSSPLGGHGGDLATGIAVDGEGNAYVVGRTQSDNFPTAGTPFGPAHAGGGEDAYVAKVNAAGSALVYSTYLGGNGDDYGNGVAVDAAGDAYVVGETGSVDFPATVFPGGTPGGNRAFVAKLDANGSSLLYSKFLCTGGPSPDPQGFTNGEGRAIVVDGSGNAYLTGACRGSLEDRTLPVTPGAFQPILSSAGYEAFVAKVNPTGSALVYASWLGGVAEDSGRGIAVDGSGNAYVTGSTSATNFPITAGAFKTTKPGGFADAFVTKVNAPGTALVYSTYLGGAAESDVGRAIAVDSSGRAYVHGTALSTDFPVTPGAFQPTYGGPSSDAFVTKLNPAGSALDYSTYFGGNRDDQGLGIAVDGAGVAHMTGATRSDSMPTVLPVFRFRRHDLDVYVAHLNPSGSQLLFSTYLAHGVEGPTGGIAIDATGADYVASATDAADLVTAGSPFQPVHGGGYADAWVAKVTPGPPPQVPADFDGNRITDVSVFRPATGTWYVQGGLNVGWGAGGDVAVPADYDGDATTDVAVFRPSTGTWFVLGGLTLAWGTSGDIAVPGDYDGNGSATPAVYRPSTGTWFVYNGATTAWGTPGDIPVPGDYDGDGDTDIAVYRPSTATWFVQGGATTTWGTSGDIPVPGDYDGDGNTDIAVFRPPTGTWYVQGGTSSAWGTAGDIPVPGDYDGDGDTNIAVYRPSDATWYVQGGPTSTWGTATDHPLPLPAAIRQAFFP